MQQKTFWWFLPKILRLNVTKNQQQLKDFNEHLMISPKMMGTVEYIEVHSPCNNTSKDWNQNDGWLELR